MGGGKGTWEEEGRWGGEVGGGRENLSHESWNSFHGYTLSLLQHSIQG